MTRVLAIDPGPHVGVAYWDDKVITDLLANGEPGEGSYYTESWREWEETPSDLYDAIHGWVSASDVVVCENFFIGGARSKSANETIEMIGVIRYVCALTGTPFVLQAPGEAKDFSSNAKLKRLGWWRPSAHDHARSASRHLLVYLVKNRYIAAERVLQCAEEEG